MKLPQRVFQRLDKNPDKMSRSEFGDILGDDMEQTKYEFCPKCGSTFVELGGLLCSAYSGYHCLVRSCGWTDMDKKRYPKRKKEFKEFYKLFNKIKGRIKL